MQRVAGYVGVLVYIATDTSGALGKPPLSTPAPAPVLACPAYGTSDHTFAGHKTSSFGPHACELVERVQAPEGQGHEAQCGRGQCYRRDGLTVGPTRFFFGAADISKGGNIE
jgi:hypothetical protein